MVGSGRRDLMSLVNIMWSKQKKKAILIFKESEVNIAAILNR